MFETRRSQAQRRGNVEPGNGRQRRVRAKAHATPCRAGADLDGEPKIMSLSSEEYSDHLQSTPVRAGFRFDEVMLPDERHITVNGLRFRYLDWGTEGQRPILFLHGGALTAHTWDL